MISIKVGDLVEYAGKPKHAKGRLRGIVMGFDVSYVMAGPSPIVEVLWNNGPGWILQSRTRAINESR